jgi:hypothetical protein
VVASDLRRFVERFADLIEQRADELTELDAAIGDADHGINMRRGVRAVREKLSVTDETTPGALLKTVATCAPPPRWVTSRSSRTRISLRSSQPRSRVYVSAAGRSSEIRR